MKILIQGIMFVVIAIGGFDFFKNRKNQKSSFEEKKIIQLSIDEIEEIRIDKGKESWSLKFSQEKWWVKASRKFPVDFTRFNAVLQTMIKIHGDQRITEKKKEFGLDEPLGKIQLTSAKGVHTYSVGSAPGPGDTIYVEDLIEGHIIVVHKFWAQIFNSSPYDFVSSELSSFIGQSTEVTFQEFKDGGDFQKGLSDGKRAVSKIIHALDKLKVRWTSEVKNCLSGKHYILRFTGGNDSLVIAVDFDQSSICLAEYNLEGMVEPLEFNKFWKILQSTGD